MFILDAKLQIANDMQKLLSKYINRLDLELQGFKTELEADKSGITEIIEKSNCLINMVYIIT